MSNKFASTIQIYNKYADKFSAHQEKKLGIEEIRTFLSLVPAGGSILDAGCGSGRDTAYFTQHGYQALGIDLSEGLLAEAKKLHPESRYQLMSLTELDFPAGSFDGVWAKASLLHLDRAELPKVLNDFYQMLKPGGTVFIQTKKGESEGTQPIPFAPDETRYFTFHTLAEMSALLEKAGFNVVERYEFNGQDRTKLAANQDWIVLFAQKLAA